MKQFSMILSAALMILIIYSCGVQGSESNNNLPKDKSTSLQELGFGSVRSVMASVYDDERIKWESKYQIQFISDIEMAKIISNPDSLIQGHASSYKGEIPSAAAGKILEKYHRIHGEKLYYRDDFWGTWCLIGIDHFGDSRKTDMGVLVIAPPSLFTPNADINKKKDPMAVIKVDYGYVVLASW